MSRCRRAISKTFTCSVCLPAFILGRQPAAKVLVITYGENLAADIAHGIRELLRASWFKAAFSTRLAADRNRVTDFATTAGGGVYAQPIGGQVTGYGANYIIVDDPLEIKDANNVVRIAFVNATLRRGRPHPVQSSGHRHHRHCRPPPQ